MAAFLATSLHVKYVQCFLLYNKNALFQLIPMLLSRNIFLQTFLSSFIQIRSHNLNYCLVSLLLMNTKSVTSPHFSLKLIPNLCKLEDPITSCLTSFIYILNYILRNRFLMTALDSTRIQKTKSKSITLMSILVISLVSAPAPTSPPPPPQKYPTQKNPSLDKS